MTVEFKKNTGNYFVTITGDTDVFDPPIAPKKN